MTPPSTSSTNGSETLDEILRFLANSASDPSVPDIPNSLLRSIIAAGPNGGLQLGKTIINISSSSNIRIGEQTLDPIASSFLQKTVADAHRSIAANGFERSLRDYFGAMREFSNSFGYDLRYVFTDHQSVSSLSQGTLSLSDVYVPLRYVSLKSNTHFDLSASTTLDIRDALSATSKIDEPLRLLFEGPAGSGKSTILRQIVAYCWDDPGQLALRSRFLPIYVRLASLAQSPGGSIEERLWASIAADNLISLNSPPPAGWFTEWPKIMESSILLLLDGFDEVGPEKQVELRGWIDRLLRQGHAVVLTSRAISSVGIVLADRFLCYRLAPFNTQQQEDLAHRWLGPKADPFLKEVRKTQSSIVSTTPLLLTVAAFVYALEKCLPKGRAGLYERFLTAWLGESRRRGLYQELGSPSEYLRETLGFLALQMTEQPSDCTENRLSSCLKSFYEKSLHRPSIEASGWARRFVEISTKRSAIFASSAGSCTWIHPTFREYLAAETLANSDLSDDKIVEYVDKWKEEPWHEVILFFLGIVSTRRDASALIEHIARQNTLEAQLFVGAAIADGTRVNPGLMSAALGSLSSLVIAEIKEREKGVPGGAATLQLASQTALRLISNFAAGMGQSEYIKNLGANVAEVAAQNRGPASDAIQALTDLGCFDELTRLASNVSAHPEAGIEAAISLLRANKSDSVLPNTSSLLAKDLGSRSAGLLTLLEPHLTSDRIVELVADCRIYPDAKSHLIGVLRERRELSALEEITSTGSMDLLARLEAALILDQQTGDSPKAFNTFIASFSDRLRATTDWDLLTSWLDQRQRWAELTLLAVSTRCPEPVGVKVVKQLAAANSPSFTYDVFQVTKSSVVKLEAAISLSSLKPGAEVLAEIQMWCSSHEITSNPELLTTWASFLFGSSRYEEAIVAFTALVSQNAADGLAFCNRGNCFRLADRLDEAIDDYTKALELDPTDVWTLVRRAHCFWSKSNEARALDDFRRAENEGFVEPRFYLYYGDSCRIQQDLVQAVKYLNKFIESYPTDSRGYYFRGLAFLDGGVPENAQTDLALAVDINNKSIGAHCALADSCTLQSLPAQAESALENALTLHPDSTSLRYRYAKTALCLGKLETAQAVADALLNSGPTERINQYLVELCRFVRTRDATRFHDGVSIVIEATETARKKFPPDDSRYWSPAVNLTIYDAALGKEEEARRLTGQLRSKDKFFGENRRIVLTALTELALLFPENQNILSFLQWLITNNPLTESLHGQEQPFPERESPIAVKATDGQHSALSIPKSSEPYPFPCYCPRKVIGGLDDLVNYGKAMLDQLETSVPAIALVTLDGPERIVGHCNFKQKITDPYNLKFCDTYRTFVDQDIKIFVAGLGMFCLLLAEPSLLERLQEDRVDTRFGISLRFVPVDPLRRVASLPELF